jgi:hypothetical protein
MIISNKNVNLVNLLNFDLLPIMKELSSDVLDELVLVQETQDFVTFRILLKKGSFLPLFSHIKVTKTPEGDFLITDVPDTYGAVQMFVGGSICRLRFPDEHTAIMDGTMELQNELPTMVEKFIRKVVSQIGTRLKTFIERL